MVCDGRGRTDNRKKLMILAVLKKWLSNFGDGHMSYCNKLVQIHKTHMDELNP